MMLGGRGKREERRGERDREREREGIEGCLNLWTI